MEAEYISSREADQVISEWAERGASVVLVEGWGDAVFTQRSGNVTLARPGVPIHRNESGDCTVLFASRFGEAVFVDDDRFECLLLRRPAGASGIEIALIADMSGEGLGADDVLLLVTVASSIRPPM